MPVIGISEKDFLRNKLVSPEWYLCSIDAVSEAMSKDGSSTNYICEGTIIHNASDGSKDFTNVPLTWNFNSKALGFVIGFLQGLGITVEPNTRYELTNAIGKQIEIFVENDTYQGRMVNRVNHKYRVPREA